MATERKAPIAKAKSSTPAAVKSKAVARPTPPVVYGPGAAAEALSVVMMPIMSVRAYGKNPRVISEKAVAKVAASIKAFGWKQPLVVDRDNTVIVGHTRLMAAASLGLNEVPVHVAHNLTKAQANAYRLADNRTGEETRWDAELVGEELAALRLQDFDLGPIGFDDSELLGYLPEPSGLASGADPDDVPDAPKVATTRLGDRITLGRHTLVCGDCTDASVWEKLLAGREAGMLWTDPPYGVSYQAKNQYLKEWDDRSNRSSHASEVENDTISPEALTLFLRASLSFAYEHTRAGASWYVATPANAGVFYSFATVMQELAIWRHTVVWIKDSFVIGRADYHYRHEDLMYGWKEGAAHTWNGGRAQDTVLEFPRPRRSEEHPTMKPVALVKRCIENSSTPDDLIVDPFAGSGTTLIAAEDCGRASALIELSPIYCDVIVSRFENATGLTAERPRR